MPLARRRFIFQACALVLIFYFVLYHFPSGTEIPNIQIQSTTADDQSSIPGVKIHWKEQPEKYPVTSYIPLPTNIPIPIPRIQASFAHESSSDRKRREDRQNAVKRAFEHAWHGYKDHAWLKDELAPISGGYRHSFGGWAATLVDGLDTLLIMGMEKEFESALIALDEIDFTTTDDTEINVFETTIRYLGGLLGAYDLSDGKYPILLRKAVEVGGLLYGAFDTPNRMPMSRWEWQRSAKGLPIQPSPSTLLAELGSLNLEFTRLTQLTGDPRFFDAVQRITDNLEHAQLKTKIPGMWPVMVNARDLEFDDNRFTLGGMADSTYEYLPKEYLLLGGQSRQYQQMYEAAIEPFKAKLLFRPLTEHNDDILLSGSNRVTGLGKPSLEPQAQHLSCFVGGMVATAAKIFDRPEDLPTARKLVDGCIWAYDLMPTGLMPEVFRAIVCDDKYDCPWDEKKWYREVHRIGAGHGHLGKDEDGDESVLGLVEQMGLQPGLTEISDTRYILRPEAIESMFIMYRITGDHALQDSAWRMFQSIEILTKTEYAHAAINDVRTLNTSRADKMESFWLAETLKYFYLIFSDPDDVSLDQFVLNTEAHPLKRPLPTT